MKRSHIIAIVVIAVAIGAIVAAVSDTSTYANFGTAFSNPGRQYHVVGTLNREKEQLYDPQSNPDLFVFWMLDDNGLEKKVQLHQHKPQDFDRSEKIVIIGSAKDADFHATDILMKCPSKYNDGSQQLTAQTR